MDDKDSNQVRLRVTRILQKTQPPNCNEQQAQKTLRQNPDTYILPADKGNSTVIMCYTEEYNTNMKDILDAADH